VSRPGKSDAPKARRVALLRGINVGGKNMLPMARLAGIFERAGCREVSTYIQSGNVLFRASGALARKLPTVISGRIEKEFGFKVPVVLRTAEELARAAAENPFLRAAVDPKSLHVLFLVDLPDPRDVAALDPGRSPPDEFAVIDREVFLKCPNGVARTRLTNDYFDRALRTVSTGRNLQTVRKLLELAMG
jgi:uncharacterized protein (DUF1697 family)